MKLSAVALLVGVLFALAAYVTAAEIPSGPLVAVLLGWALVGFVALFGIAVLALVVIGSPRGIRG